MRSAPPQGPITSVSVIGLGRIGAPLAACLATRGLEVIGVDVDERKVDAVNAGDPPVREPALGVLIGAAGDALRATTSTRQAVLATDATFITVPTPAESDGSLSLGHLQPACSAVGGALRRKPAYHLVAVTSTVMPGATGGPLTAAITAASGKSTGSEWGIAYVPEFVALGTAINDFLSPDFVLIGEADPVPGELLEQLFVRVCESESRIVRTSLVAAELAKLAVNAFLATKISFANVLTQICEGISGCDVDAVTSVVGRDSRIGDKYLTGAMGFGGPCLPRDSAALATLARGLGATPALADATLEVNRAQLERLVERVRAAVPPGGRVAVCGLAFKPGTDVVEAAPAALLARRLADDGIPVAAFDPMVTELARGVLGQAVELTPTLEACVAAADVVVLCTPTASLAALDTSTLAPESHQATIIDCWRSVDPARVHGADHVMVGRGSADVAVDGSRVAQGVL